MTKEQLQEFEEYAEQIKHNRDYYSRAKIIEMMVEKVRELNPPVVSGCFSKDEAMNLILYGRNDNVIIDEDTKRLDVIFWIMLQKIKPDFRESFENILWRRIMNLANYR